MKTDAIDRAIRRVYAAQGYLGLEAKYAFKLAYAELELLEKELRLAWLESLQVPQ